MTSLNAPGFSISLLNISAIISRLTLQHMTSTSFANKSDDILALIDAPTDSTAWAGVRTHWPRHDSPRDSSREQQETNVLLASISVTPSSNADKNNDYSWDTLGISTVNLEKAIRESCASVINVAPELTEFDTVLGDGDCGETFTSGAKGECCLPNYNVISGA